MGESSEFGAGKKGAVARPPHRRSAKLSYPVNFGQRGLP
jgi:hypothetical protein